MVGESFESLFSFAIDFDGQGIHGVCYIWQDLRRLALFLNMRWMHYGTASQEACLVSCPQDAAGLE